MSPLLFEFVHAELEYQKRQKRLLRLSRVFAGISLFSAGFALARLVGC